MTRQEELKVLIPHLRSKVGFYAKKIEEVLNSFLDKSYIDDLRYALDDLSEKITDLQELQEEEIDKAGVGPAKDELDDLPF